jgi:hypothetical protein
MEIKMRNELIKISDAEYFASEGLSNSFLKDFDKSPALAFHNRKSTKAMDDGTILHALILQPEKEMAVIIPKKSKNYRNTNEYKLIESNISDDQIIRFPDEMEDLYQMKENVMNLTFDHIGMEEILSESQKEISCFSGVLGFQARCKIDVLWQDNIIFDLKTTTDIDRFKWQVKDLKYYRQMDWYKTVYSHYSGIPYENIRFIFIAVETKFPFGAKFIELNEEYRYSAEKENILAVKKYADWLERGADRTEIYLDTYELIGW